MRTEGHILVISEEAVRRRHEFRNPPARWILITAASVIGLLAIGWVFPALLLMRRTGRDQRPMRTAPLVAADCQPLDRFPAPALQVHGREDLETLRKREDKELAEYGWVDRSNGAVRIPIERAMQLIAQRGLKQPAGRPGKSSEQLIRERAEER